MVKVTNQSSIFSEGTTRGSLVGLKKRAGGSAWLSCRSWLAPLRPEGGEEIGVQPFARHTGQDEAETVPHLWGSLGILLQRGNAAKLGNWFPALPPPHVNGIMWSIYFTVCEWWSLCVNPEKHISPQTKEGRDMFPFSKEISYIWMFPRVLAVSQRGSA